MTQWLERWKNLWERLPGGAAGGRTVNPRVFWLGTIGILLLVVGGMYDGTSAKQPPFASSAAQQDTAQPKVQAAVGVPGEAALEAKLAQVLSKVRGAGNVAVSVTLAGDARQEHAKNRTKETKVVEEKDTAGGVRTTTESKESEEILMSKETGADRPVTVTQMRPEVKGVLVVAEGAADSGVKAALTRAVETGLGIASYKITVLPQER